MFFLSKVEGLEKMLWGTLQRTDCAQSDPRIEATFQPRQPTPPKGAYVARTVHTCSPFVHS